MFKRIFILVTFLQTVTSLFAQQQSKSEYVIDTMQVLSGTVVDSSWKEPLVFATVRFVLGNGVVMDIATTDLDGKFEVVLNDEQYDLFVNDDRASVVVESYGYKEKCYCLKHAVGKECDEVLSKLKSMRIVLSEVQIKMIKVSGTTIRHYSDSLAVDE